MSQALDSVFYPLVLAANIGASDLLSSSSVPVFLLRATYTLS